MGKQKLMYEIVDTWYLPHTYLCTVKHFFTLEQSGTTVVYTAFFLPTIKISFDKIPTQLYVTDHSNIT